MRNIHAPAKQIIHSIVQPQRFTDAPNIPQGRTRSGDQSNINFHLISRSLHQREEDSAPAVSELSAPEYSRKGIFCKNIPKHQQTTKDIT